MRNRKISAILILIVTICITFVTGKEFKSLRKVPEITPGPNVDKIEMLSDYFAGIKGTAADTKIYRIKGDKPGGKVLVLGGTHPNEPSGHLSAVILIQNLKVDAGEILIIPYTNRSGFTHNDPQEGSPHDLHFTTKDGEEVVYRYGSRATNPVDQWPDPDVYVHASSGQRLSGSETRNINRAYPGKENGNITEKTAFAIAQLIKKEDINLTFDLHEASPEYPVINATVSHEKGMPIAALGVMELQLKGIEMSLEPSPTNLHGLTHRELGDFTDTIPLLMETANASQGRLRGKTDEALALTGKDDCYLLSQKLGFLYVPYDEKGHPIEERVGRHLQGIIEYVNAYNEQNGDKKVTFSGIPTYEELFTNAKENELGGKKLGQYMIK